MAVDVREPGPVLIIDKDEDFRQEISRLLEQAGYTSRQAANGQEALELSREERPELVIVEVVLPEVSGYEVCRELRDLLGEGLPVVLVSGERTDTIDRVAGLLIGADEYLVKPLEPDELLARVRSLMRRAAPVTPVQPTVISELTNRELEVLHLLAEGLEQSEIARRLVISPKTVSTHTQNIFRKLGVRNRAQAVAAAYQVELLGSPA
jgi:two-component system, OmpR family, phosphate regulon response regulator PhoB